jgi:type IV secretion system protein VirB8
MKLDTPEKIVSDAGVDLRARYYATSDTWAQSAADKARTSRHWAWRITGAAILIAVLQAIALAALLPLKTVVPYTILVDRHDGTAEIAQGVKLGPLAEDQALTQSMLVQYVLARETFDAADLKNAYQRAVLWSADPARAEYVKSFDRNDPNSMLRTVPPNTVISVVVRSASLLSRNTALVRFETHRTDAAGMVGLSTPVTAVITFRFTGAPAKPEDRFLNPLGFQVLKYRRDVEVATPAEAPSTSGEVTGDPAGSQP